MAILYTDEAELYDIAFDWDVDAELAWLLERLGPVCRSVLEPGCGSGRMLEAFARRGIEITGIDNSPPMLELARRRLGAAVLRAELVEADMADFDLGRRFDGAVCPINTLGHLRPDELARHLEAVARHLEPGARYLVQIGLVEPGMPDLDRGSHWEASRGGTTLRVSWGPGEFDFERGVSREPSRIEVLSGPRAGEVLEEVHVMTVWSPESWPRLVEASPFTQRATYDGGRPERPRVEAGAAGGLLWHELVR